MDGSIFSLARASYSRAVIKIYASVPLVPGIDVEIEGIDLTLLRQIIKYKYIHLFCPHFGGYCHRASGCSNSSISIGIANIKLITS